MRHLWISLLLALTVRGAQLVPRGSSGPDLGGRLLDARQLPTAVSSFAGLPTEPVSTDSAESNPPAPTSSVVASLTTNPVATISDSALITSDALSTTSNIPTTAVQTAPATTSSVPLLFTQTSTSTRPSSSATSAPTSAPVTDINVPFSQSKYHQMIIALGCFAVGLLIAFIVTVIIALRARADVDLLRDRLNRYEEGLQMDQRKEESPYDIGYGVSRGLGQRPYGRVSTNDPDDGARVKPRRSASEGQFASLASTASGKGGSPKNPRPQPGQRHVTFSEDDHSTDASPLLSTTTSRDPAPQYPQTRPLTIAPKSTDRDPYGSSALVNSPPQLTSSPPPQSNFTSAPFAPSSVHPSSLQPRMSDPGRVATPPIRRLPVTPGASVSSHEVPGYKDPFATGHGRSASAGYPPY